MNRAMSDYQNNQFLGYTQWTVNQCYEVHKIHIIAVICTYLLTILLRSLLAILSWNSLANLSLSRHTLLSRN